MFERATRRVQDVADDPDVQAVEAAEPLAQRVDVQQRLRRVLVLAVAGVDDARGRPAGDQRGGADVRRADHDQVRAVGGERLDGVLERLALLDAASREATKLITSADSDLAASSNELRVRVEAS